MEKLSRQQKKRIRLDLLDLTEDPDWYKDPVAIRQVDSLRSLIDHDEKMYRLTGRKPLKRIDFWRLEPGNFRYLRSLGYQVKEVRRACLVSEGKFYTWLRAYDLTMGSKLKNKLDHTAFTERDKNIPYWNGIETDPAEVKKLWEQLLKRAERKNEC